MNYLEKYLFETGAIRVSDADTPFWYTSGKIGPFFINTHFLYGGEDNADKLLKFIDENLGNPVLFVRQLYDRVNDFYETNAMFRKIADIFYEGLRQDPGFSGCAYVSGGERRDWFFSPVISELSGKRHLFIFKNLDIYGFDGRINDLGNAGVAHIADLVNQASSYERAWIPALKAVKGELNFSGSVVDRSQGGKEYLAASGIDCFSSVIADSGFFKMAMENGVINGDQFDLIRQFIDDPDEYGKKFIMNNREFLRSSLISEDKSVRSKSERCIKENPYGIDFVKLGF
jgi:hypothetical protein